MSVQYLKSLEERVNSGVSSSTAVVAVFAIMKELALKFRIRSVPDLFRDLLPRDGCLKVEGGRSRNRQEDPTMISRAWCSEEAAGGRQWLTYLQFYVENPPTVHGSIMQPFLAGSLPGIAG